MRRPIVFPFLGLVEATAAVMMAVLGCSLPNTDDVRQSFEGARKVTAASGQQIRLLRDQVADLRRSELRRTTDHLQAATRSLTEALRKSRVDFDTIRTVRDATGQAAEGLETLAQTLDPKTLSQLGEGLGATAEFLDQQVLPAANRSADALDAASESLQASARRIAQVLKAVPLDLKPVREVYDSLSGYDAGLVSLHATLDPRRLDAMRRGVQGAKGVVFEAAGFAEQVSAYTYPVVTINGMTPKVKNRAFWPKGTAVSADMRKLADGLAGMDREIESLATEFPKLQAAVAESRKSIGATRTVLALALARQAEIERLLADGPAQATRLTDELPRMTADLSKALRSTAKLKELAVALRQSQRGIDTAVANWPRLRTGLSSSAAILLATRDQLDQLIEHRAKYEAARDQVEGFSEEFAEFLPAFADGLYARLDQEDRALAEMEGGIAQVETVLPTYSRAASRCLDIARVVVWLLAAIGGLHGSYLIATAYLSAAHPRTKFGESS